MPFRLRFALNYHDLPLRVHSSITLMNERRAEETNEKLCVNVCWSELSTTGEESNMERLCHRERSERDEFKRVFLRGKRPDLKLIAQRAENS